MRKQFHIAKNKDKQIFGATFLAQFWPAMWATVIGGTFLTLIFFALREFLFSMPTIAGVWACSFVVGESSYKPYKGMTVVHQIALLQRGGEITGSGEKDSERSLKNGEMPYIGEGRTQIKLHGVIEKNSSHPIEYASIGMMMVAYENQQHSSI